MKFLSRESKLLVQEYENKNIKTAQDKIKDFLQIAVMNNNQQIQFEKQSNSLFVQMYGYRIFINIIDNQINKIIKLGEQPNQIQQEYTSFQKIQNILKKLKLRDSIFIKYIHIKDLQ